MQARRILFSLALVLVPASTGLARFAHVETEVVPIERLLANIEKIRQQQEAVLEDGQSTEEIARLHFQMGRIHAMAFARRSEEAHVRKQQGPGSEPEFPWYGHAFGDHDQFHVEMTEPRDPAKEKAALAHLARAIEHYRRALELAPQSSFQPAVALGLAWALDQAGEDADARKRYQELIEATWEKEKDHPGGMEGWSITEEAIHYLEPMLDPAKPEDQPLLASLTEIKTKLSGKDHMITPILVPLVPATRLGPLLRRGVEVTFDLDGFGPAHHREWPGSDLAFLVHDPRHTGTVTSGKQLFGSSSFWIFWRDGYQAMSALDDDGDGRLRGAELAGLALWCDRDGDGVSDPGEVSPLEHAGIRSLGCNASRGPEGILTNARGVTLITGETRPTFDWVVRSERR